MSNRSAKPMSSTDPGETAQYEFNDVDATKTVNGFLVGKVGRKIVMTVGTDTIPNDKEIYTFSEDGITLYVYDVIYTDGTRTVFKSAERTA